MGAPRMGLVPLLRRPHRAPHPSPREDTAGRWQSVNQERGPHPTLSLLAPRAWISSLQDCEKSTLESTLSQLPGWTETRMGPELPRHSKLRVRDLLTSDKSPGGRQGSELAWPPVCACTPLLKAPHLRLGRGLRLHELLCEMGVWASPPPQ